MRAWRWRIGIGLLGLLLTAGAWLIVTQAGLATVIAAVAFARGGQVEYRALQGRLLDGGTVEGLRYRDEHLDLAIASLESRWRWRGFEVRVGETVIRDPVLAIRRRGDPPRIPRVFGLVAIEHIVIERPALTVDGRERPVPERIEGALRMTRAAIEFPTVTAYYRATGGFASFGEVRVQGRGEVRGGTPISYQVEARAEAASPNLGTVGAELSADGAWPQLLVRELTLSGAGGEARFSGSIDLAHELDVALRGEWQDVAVNFTDGYEFVSDGNAELHGPWAALRATGVGRMPRTPAGDLELQFDVARRGPGFVVHAVDGRFAPRGEFELHGEYEPGASAPRIAVDIDWRDLVVTTPLAGAVTSADGSMRITGTTEAYRAWLRGSLDGERLVPLMIESDGEGDATGIALEQVAIVALGGTVQGKVRVAFGAEASVDFELSGANLDPATRWPQLPGALAFSTTGRLARNDSGFRLVVEELRTEGRLRGFPVSGFLRGLAFADARWTIPEFRLHSGASRLSGSGLLDSRAEFNISLHSPNLGELVPEGRGELALDAALTGAAGDHTLRVTASGRDIRLFGARAASLSIEGSVNTAPDGPILATARVSTARWLGQRIDQITLDLAGTGASHSSRLLLIGPGRRLEARLAGGVLDAGWHGELSELSLDGPVLGPWQLVAATGMSISRTGQRLESFCLRGDPGELCAFARRTAAGNWQAGVRGQHLPLARIPVPEGYGIDLLGQFDFDLDAAGIAGDVERFTLSAALEQGEIVSELLEPIAQHIPLEGATLTAGYAAGVLTAEGGVYAPAIAERPLNVSLRLENYSWGRGRTDETRLQGRVTFDLTELSPLAVFVPQIARPEGLITIDLAASGTLAQPLFDGRIDLREVSFDLPRFDARVEDLRLVLTGDPSQRLRLDGGMRSGAGSVAISGEVRTGGEQGVALDARINGAAFEVMNTAAARVVVSPDVTVIADRRGMAFAGTLLVPSAQLHPMQMQPATTISEDVIIIADAEQGARAPTPWPVTADLVVELGDAVQADGPLFETRLGGRLRVRRESGRATTASGELTIDGDVLAYGARLKIANGRMIFAGPITEPALDLRAQREIDALTVGITVSGTASTPEISLFSSPALPQDRILSYLVMGKPLNELSTTEGSSLLGTAASLGLRNNDIVTGRIARTFGLDQLSLESGATLGDTSVVIGKYLTPKLYLSYGIGLFEPVGTTRLRYEINRRWSIQAEQSEETGVDVFYRIER